jgi:hypothetical protein
MSDQKPPAMTREEFILLYRYVRATYDAAYAQVLYEGLAGEDTHEK